MKPFVNLEETLGKVVGHRCPQDDPLAMTQAHQTANAKAWKRAFGTLPIRKGVYRFRTHEEADEWLWQKLDAPTPMRPDESREPTLED